MCSIFAMFVSVVVTGAVAESRPAPDAKEYFVAVRRGGERDELRSLVRIDSESGKVGILRNLPTDPAAVPLLHSALMDRRGRPMGVQPSKQVPKVGDNTLLDLFLPGELSTSGSEPVIRGVEEGRYIVASVSPDGKRVVLLRQEKELLLVDAAGVHSIPTSWWIAGPFSWDNDCKRATFYFAGSNLEDDRWVQEHGLAVLTEDGRLRELVKPSTETATPANPSAKLVAPGWGRSGRFIYFTRGLAPDDARRKLEPAQRDTANPRSAPTVTCRVDAVTGDVEEVGLGSFAGVSPDEKYVLTYPCLQATDDGRWVWRAGRIDLADHRTTYLPEMRMPILSPNGKQVACLFENNEVGFFETENWRPCGSRVRLGNSVTIEEWYRDFRWIVPEEEAMPKQP